jgi:hypothetical protein
VTTLICLSGDAPPGDHPVTDGPDQPESGWKTLKRQSLAGVAQGMTNPLLAIDELR